LCFWSLLTPSIFRHLLQELQKESTVQSQRNKVLESENALLMSEMEQLRQEVKILEDNLDQSIMREEENLNLDKIGQDGGEGGEEMEKLKKMLKEQRLKFDVRDFFPFVIRIQS